MQYRALSPTGDYQFGLGSRNFLANSPATVAQAVQTRLLLSQGEWFLDVTEGTPYGTEILGEGTVPTYDLAIRARILGTEGVTDIASYSSSFNSAIRGVSVAVTIDTVYGSFVTENGVPIPITVQVPLP